MKKTKALSALKALKALLIVIILIVIDQLTKFLATSHLKDDYLDKSIIIIKDIFRLYYLENKGAAFGIFQNQILLFIIITIFAIAAIIYVYFKLPDDKKYNAVRILFVFIVSGAIGNFIDRVRNNYVVDFFYFELIDFPVFNIADCYVTVSSIILLVLFIFYYKDEDFNFLFKGKGKVSDGKVESISNETPLEESSQANERSAEDGL